MNPTEIRTAYQAGELSLAEVKRLIEALGDGAATYPLSEGQRGLWALQRSFPEATAYNLPLAFRVAALDPDPFRQACRHLARQHPILCGAVEERQGTPCLRVPGDPDLLVEEVRLPSDDADRILAELRDRARRPFRLDQGPLLRLHLLFVPDGDAVVLLNTHHLVSDGRSLAIVMETLFDAYRVLREGKVPHLVTPEATFEAYVQAERQLLQSDEGRARLAYWKQQLAEPLPSLDLYVEKSRSDPREKFRGATLPHALDRATAQRIKTLARRQRVYVTAVLLGLLKVLLYRYSGQSDLIVGMPVSERTDPRFDDVVGFFINMVPIRSRLEDETPFSVFLDTLQRAMLDGQAASYPFPALARELRTAAADGGAPFFEVSFSYQDFHEGLDRESLPVTPIAGVQQEGEYELVLEVVERAQDFDLHWRYNPGLYADATIRRMMACFERLIEAASARPEAPLRELVAAAAEQEQALIEQWNATEAEYPSSLCAHHLFVAQAAKTPDNPAVRFGDRQLTYRELEEQSAALAEALRAQGVSMSGRIALCVERSLDMVVALLGILRAGAAYVPLDPGFPESRLAYVVRHSGVDVVLTQCRLRERVTALVAAGRPDASVLAVDELPSGLAGRPDAPASGRDEAGPDDLAYLMYTSGSTGDPKGVMIPHRALTNFLCSMAVRPGLGEHDRLLAVTTLSFDISGLELLLPLIVGAQCDICDAETARNAERLKARLAQRPPTVMQATPSTWSMLFRAGWRNEEKIRVLCGGEALPRQLKQWLDETGSEVWNLFGPTETTIWSTIERLDKDRPITIGRPIANTSVHILDPLGRRAPIGAPGELCIAGHGLAKGYYKDPELTDRKFIDDPLQPGRRLYRTGDLARWLPEGRIELLGRMDWQVKLHGFRIELKEIECHLNRQPEVEESVVVLQEEEDFSRLVAFYKPAPGSAARGEQVAESLRRRLKEALPHYMIPAGLVAVDAFPLTPNGKTDRVALTSRRPQSTEASRDPSSGSSLEETLLAIWKSTLRLEALRPTERFFDVGGDSVSAVILADRIAKAVQVPFTVTDLLSHYCVRRIADHLRETGLPSPSSGRATEAPAVPCAAQSRIGPTSHLPDYYEHSFAIIGLSCRFPDAEHYWDFWESLVEGRDSARFFSEEELREAGVPESLIRNPDYVPMQLAIRDKDCFDPELFNLSRRSAAFMDPQFRMLLMHAWEAVEDAGYLSHDIPDTSVFMSVSNSYYQTLLRNTGAIDSSDEYVAWLLAQGGTVPAMISYELGFRGPSLFVHTNCSSSLSGLSAACNSLRAGEARYALVGAAKLTPSSEIGYVYEPGLNFSSDGRCRAFDAAADGMTNGEGVAVILVKRALDAIADGDHVYALLRGVGLNNDGAQKPGFYAPSVAGQSEVIDKVLRTTGVDPETIGYVEAHGTGTALGDPIEVRALTQVYRKYTDRKQFCGLGSVKSNIGHLDTAAGLAGCMKVALSLSEGVLPPSLHYTEPSPEIPFSDSPFYVVAELQDWPRSGSPRRAAVSSFGIGGTNAHAILEAYEAGAGEPAAASSASGGASCLVPLSAKSDERLTAYAEKLLAFLRDRPSRVPPLRELAYTYQVGRAAMASRLALLVSTPDELAAALSAYIESGADGSRTFHGSASAPSEGLRLLGEDEDSRELIEKWVAKGRLDKLAAFWAQGGSVDWSLLYAAARPRRASLPTYPFGREPCGPVGPLAASSAATTPRQQWLHPLVQENTSNLTEQSFRSVFTGDEPFLRGHRIQGVPVMPAVAFMEMAQAAIRLALEPDTRDTAEVHLQNLLWLRPFTVGVQAEEVRITLFPEENGDIGLEITSPAPAAEEEALVHCQGVAVLETPKGPSSIRLEEVRERTTRRTVGGRQCFDLCRAGGYEHGPELRGIEKVFLGEDEALAELVLPPAAEPGPYRLHPSMLESALIAALPLKLGDGMAPPDAVLEHPARRVMLPFALDRLETRRPSEPAMWAWIRWSSDSSARVPKLDIDLCDEAGAVCARLKGLSYRSLPGEVSDPGSEPVGTLMYRPVWQEQSVEADGAPDYGEHYVFTCAIPRVQLPTTEEVEWQWVHLASERETLAGRFEECSVALLSAVQELVRTKPEGGALIQLLVPATGPDSVYAACGALLRTARREHPWLSVQTLLVGEDDSAEELRGRIRECRRRPAEDAEVRYEGGRPLNRSLEELADAEQGAAHPWRKGATYLITGGAGGLGLLLAREIVRQVNEVRLVLIGRSALPPSTEEVLQELGEAGARVEYRSVDVADARAVEALIADLRRGSGGLSGILHGAGVIRDEAILSKTPAVFRQVLSPKVRGIVNLDEATRGVRELDFLVSFSSVSGFLGNAGQADYATANAFLSAFAAYRNALVAAGTRSGRTLAIAWPLWRDGGMGVDEATEELLEHSFGLLPMPTESGIDSLYRALRSGEPSIVVMHGVLARLRQELLRRPRPKPRPARAPTAADADPDLVEKITRVLIGQIGRLVDVSRDQLDLTAELSRYGFDSISFTKLANALNKQLALSLTPTVFFEYPTVELLAAHLGEAYREELGKALAGTGARPLAAAPSAEAIEPVHETPGLRRRFFRRPVEAARPPSDARAVAIIGMSGRFPMAPDLAAFWANLRDGRDCISEIPAERWDWRAWYGDPLTEQNKTKIKWGGFIDGIGDFDPLFFGISPREAELTDPQQRLLMLYVWMAIEDAGYSPASLSGSSTAILVGTSNSGYGTLVARSNVAIDGAMTTTGAPSMGPNRMSYLLNLHGPSEPIETACSSSLVAIHRAVTLIERGECDQAIVGGAHTVVTPDAHIAFDKVFALAADGRCKTFSEGADGFALGEGVGMLFLKPLDAAERDGDHIYGLIRGSAENHGGRASSPTAPNPNAQADLLARAYEKARIDPRTLGYIEAHGTGTKLGDPTEVKGLKKAFRQLAAASGSELGEGGGCGLGSVKTNIGHAVFAAGVASVIKVLLQMKHRQLVKSLHCERVNPYLELEDSPFYIVDRNRDWPRMRDAGGKELPRRAGVSSFGLGGVNAHVVLEEYLAPEPASAEVPPEGPLMIVLSARSEARLLEAAGNLLDFLQSTASAELPGLEDLAYTLQVGRDAMDERLGLVAGSLDELREKLERFVQCPEEAHDLFRGQVQRNREAVAVFSADDDLREITERWIERRKYPRILEWWVKGLSFDWTRLYEGRRPRRVALPTYPFARDRYWVPAGEAAGRQSGEGKCLHPLVHRNTSSFEAQRFSSTLTGEEPFLRDHEIHGSRVLPAVAYLEMVEAAVRMSLGSSLGPDHRVDLRNLVWLRPLVVDGQAKEIHVTLTPGDDGEIHYEVISSPDADSAGAALVHSQGLATVEGAPEPAPALDLEALRRRITGEPIAADRCYALCRAAGLVHGPGMRGIRRVFASAGEVLAQLELPPAVSDSAGAYRLHPTLLDAALVCALPLSIAADRWTETAELARSGAKTSMLPFALERLCAYRPCPPTLWVWVRRAEGSTDAVPRLDFDLCDDQGQTCVRMSGYTARVLDGGLSENGGEPTSTLLFEPVWEELPASSAAPVPDFVEHRVFSCGVPVDGELLKRAIPGLSVVALGSSDLGVEGRFEAHALALAGSIRELSRRTSPKPVLLQLLAPADGEGRLDLALSGLLRSASLEHEHLSCQVIGIEAGASAERVIEIVRENRRCPEDVEVRYEGGRRMARFLNEVAPTTILPGTPWKQGGVYLITGGAGALGRLFAREIVEQVGDAVVILVGRSAADPALRDELARDGARIEYRSVDVCDFRAVSRLVEEIEKDHGALNGVIHAAGVIRDSYIRTKTDAELREVLAPKARGVLSLDQATRHSELDLFVLFSSVAGALGNAGQSDYAAANAFLDAFAEARQSLCRAGERRGQTLSINWPLWRDGGMRVDDATETLMKERVGLVPMDTPSGLRAFYQAVAQGKPRVMVVSGVAPRLKRSLLATPQRPAKEEVESASATATPAGDPDILHRRIRDALIQVVCRIQKLSPAALDVHTELSHYGFESIAFTSFASLLNRQYGLDLTPTVFFEHPTVERMAAYLLEAHSAPLARALAVAPEAVPRSDAEPAAGNAPPSVGRRKPGPRRAPVPVQDTVSAQETGAAPEPIAVVGMSGRFPMAEDLAAFWKNLEAGRDCITEIPEDRWDWRAIYGDPQEEGDKTNIRWGGFIDGVGDFDPGFFGVSPHEATLMDPQQRLLMTYVWLAIEDAGYSASSLSGTDTGLFIGTSAGGYGALIASARAGIDGVMTTTGAPSMGPNRMSYLLNLHGPSEPIETACSSSLVALHRALVFMRQGECEQAIVGGVQTVVTPAGHIAFAKAGALAQDGRCKAFSDKADGFAIGEGVGMLFLKKLSAAERDGDHIYGLIRGSAENHDGRASSPTTPNPSAQCDLLVRAYRSAGVDPATLGYIEAHGTGTRLGDPMEIQGLKKAFAELGHTGSQPAHCGLGSVKTNIGHTVFAAGVAGVIKVLLQLGHGKLVKSLHSEGLNPYIDLEGSPFYLVQESREWVPIRTADGRQLPRRAGVSSFGLGGVNAHVIIEEYVGKEPAADIEARPKPPALLVFSAKNARRLEDVVRKWAAFLDEYGEEAANRDLAAMAYTLQVGREAMEERLAIQAETAGQLLEKLRLFLSGAPAGDGLFRGSVRQNREALAIFNEDGDTAQAVEAWVRKQKYHRLLDLWVKGLDFDWRRLYGEHRPHRLSLPTYPFGKKRYWIDPIEGASPRRTGRVEAAAEEEVRTPTASGRIAPDGGETPVRPERVRLADPASFAATAVRRASPELEPPVSSVLKAEDVLGDLKSAMPVTEKGMVPTLNRTGVMVESLNPCSTAFAAFAGRCGGEVLDIGCAYGVATVAALERGARVLAVDMERKHLDILRDRLREEALSRVRTQQGVLPEVDFEPGRFAAVHASRVIHFLNPEEVRQALRKMFLWLKPGGKLFVVSDSPYVGYWAPKASEYEARKAAGDPWPGYIPDVREVFDSRIVAGGPTLINPLDPDILRRECEAAGFAVERVGYEGVGKDLKILVPTEGKDHVSVIAVKPTVLPLGGARPVAPARTGHPAASDTAPAHLGQSRDTRDVRATVRSMLAAELDMEAEEVDDEMSFIDMGLDSITSVTWFKKMNTHFGVALPATKVYDYPNVARLSELLESRLQASGGAVLDQSPEQPCSTDLKGLLRQVQQRQLDAAEASRLFAQLEPGYRAGSEP